MGNKLPFFSLAFSFSPISRENPFFYILNPSLFLYIDSISLLSRNEKGILIFDIFTYDTQKGRDKKTGEKKKIKRERL